MHAHTHTYTLTHNTLDEGIKFNTLYLIDVFHEHVKQ